MTVHPTPSELAILNALWDRGPGTVQEVIEALPSRDVGYTTVLKTLQIMEGKGLVTRDATRRPHVWSAAVAQEQTQSSLVSRLVDRAFQGSTASLVLRALGEKRATREELAEIRSLLDKLADDEEA